jgi:hypothetical protein
MDPDQLIVLKTYSLMTAAESDAARLRAGEIKCQIQTDDCGGMYPSLQLGQGIKLLVAAADEGRARDILSQPGEFPPGELERLASAPVVETTAAPAKSKLFLPGLTIGLLVGVLGCLAYQEARQAGRHEYYVGNEGWVYEGKHLVMAVQDRNGDHKWDLWWYYGNDQLTRSDADENFDGKIDSWAIYSNGNWTKTWYDTDFNGVPDVTNYFKCGVLERSDWQPNGTNVILLRELFTNGNLAEVLQDLDRDGNFDVSVKYGPFHNPIQTNFLNRTNPFQLLSLPPR